MEKEKRLELVRYNNRPLKAGVKCVYRGVKLVTKKRAETRGCVDCFFNWNNSCPCNYNCSYIVYVKEIPRKLTYEEVTQLLKHRHNIEEQNNKTRKL